MILMLMEFNETLIIIIQEGVMKIVLLISWQIFADLKAKLIQCQVKSRFSHLVWGSLFTMNDASVKMNMNKDKPCPSSSLKRTTKISRSQHNRKV